MVSRIDKSFPLRLARKINARVRADQFSGALLIRRERRDDYLAHRLDVVILGNQSSCAGKVASDIHELITEAQG